MLSILMSTSLGLVKSYYLYSETPQVWSNQGCSLHYITTSARCNLKTTVKEAGGFGLQQVGLLTLNKRAVDPVFGRDRARR